MDEVQSQDESNNLNASPGIDEDQFQNLEESKGDDSDEKVDLDVGEMMNSESGEEQSPH